MITSIKFGWNDLSILQLQKYNRCSLGMDNYIHPTAYRICYHLSMLGWKLIRVSKRGYANTMVLAMWHKWGLIFHEQGLNLNYPRHSNVEKCEWQYILCLSGIWLQRLIFMIWLSTNISDNWNIHSICGLWYLHQVFIYTRSVLMYIYYQWPRFLQITSHSNDERIANIM